MRRSLLENVQGLKKAEALETLDKYAPLFPVTKYFTALSMSGTAGYFLFKVLDKVVIESLGKSFSFAGF